jgi:hypothetical protein
MGVGEMKEVWEIISVIKADYGPLLLPSAVGLLIIAAWKIVNTWICAQIAHSLARSFDGKPFRVEVTTKGVVISSDGQSRESGGRKNLKANA